MRASRKYLDLAKPLVDYKSNKRLAPGVGESSIFKLNLYDDSVSQSVASGLSYRIFTMTPCLRVSLLVYLTDSGLGAESSK
jgi:hypothetical protein